MARTRKRKPSAFIDYLRAAWLDAIVAERPKGVRLHNWLTFVFCLETRAIALARSRRSFEITGVFMEEGVHPVEGLAGVKRKVAAGELLCLRHDTLTKFYEVETTYGVFKLNDQQWRDIQRYIALPHDGWPAARAGHRDGPGTGMGEV